MSTEPLAGTQALATVSDPVPVKTPERHQWHSYLTFGSGIGIECQGDDLLVTAVHVRFGRVTLLGELRLRDISSRPAADWGSDYESFVKGHDLQHLAAHVVLPSEEVTIRVLSLPPIGKKELEAAVALQIDSLHPYNETDEIAYAWSKLSSPGSVLVAITRQAVVQRYSTLFAEAGVKLASMTVSAAAIYTGLRLVSPLQTAGFAAFDEDEAGVEFYGESESRAVLSFRAPAAGARIESYLRSELRLPVDQSIVRLRDLLPTTARQVEGDYVDIASPGYSSVRSYCAALAGACPLLSATVNQTLNLLPKELRESNSRLIYVPTLVLLVGLLVAGAIYAIQTSWQRNVYLKTLNAQIAKLEPAARRSQWLDKSIADAISRTRQVDAFRSRSKADLDALNELSRLLQPPVFLNNLEIGRNDITVIGEAESAAGLLKIIDSSPLFKQSAFVSSIGHQRSADTFHIRAVRQQVIQ